MEELHLWAYEIIEFFLIQQLNFYLLSGTFFYLADCL